MQMLLQLIIIGVSLFPNEEPLESVSNIVSVISELAVVEADVAGIQPVDTEAVATEAVETEAVETEAVATQVVQQDTCDVDQVVAEWAQLDPSTRAAILMLVEADRMTHAK